MNLPILLSAVRYTAVAILLLLLTTTMIINDNSSAVVTEARSRVPAEVSSCTMTSS